MHSIQLPPLAFTSRQAISTWILMSPAEHFQQSNRYYFLALNLFVKISALLPDNTLYSSCKVQVAFSI